jgi:hypothetical protein
MCLPRRVIVRLSKSRKIREETDKIEATLDAREPAGVAEEIGKRGSAIRSRRSFRLSQSPWQFNQQSLA